MAVDVATPQAVQLCSSQVAESGMGWAEWARLFLLFVTAAGAWGIAAVNWRNQKLERTTGLVRMVSLDSSLAERLARIFHYRRRSKGYADPYTGQTSLSFENDLILVLNFFESVCIEVTEGLVSKRKIREHMGPMIIGTKNLLGDLANAQSAPLVNVEGDYKVLVHYIEMWSAAPILLPRDDTWASAIAQRNRFVIE